MEEKWTLHFHPATERMFIVGQGFATEEKCRVAAQRFLELLGSRTVEIVVDAGRVSGYASGARRAWQECFYPVRKQLTRLVIVGTNVPAMVRMAATVVAAVIGVPISFYKTIDEVDRAVAPDKTG